MRYFSMFSGIGGFEYGIQNAFSSYGQQRKDSEGSSQGSCLFSEGEQSDKPEERGHNTCVGYSEVDKYATKVYERNFDGHRNYGDATKINAKELPDFELLVGGFPCQAFSVAGKRAGFNDTRGTLFFDIARILKEKKPRHLVLENVKGLLTHDKGLTFQTILGVLADLGYRVEWQVLNSKDFGVPQNRERVFIIGHLRGECRRKVFPIRRSNQMGSKKNQAANTLTSNYWKGAAASRPIPTDGTRIRRLTPRECERLQGFPDDWTQQGIEYQTIVDNDIDKFPVSVKMSDTQRYKMCGNAVTTNVVQAVMEGLLCP